jgi:Cof subfamily protein (haloacid dehalogenase superfamily)
MQLIFFDLDGTLLNEASEISIFTKETLILLREKDIAYTVATGRTMLSAQRIVDGHDFDLPHIYNNGVTIWDPKIKQLTFENLLSNAEISTVLDCAFAQGITPFVNVIGKHHNQNHQHFIFHSETRHDAEKELVEKYFSRTNAKLLPLDALPLDSQVTNISMIGQADTINKMWLELNTYANLIAYSGPAVEGKNLRWMDVHHCLANKGAAVTNLKRQLGASKVICFGDGDNDLSMFALADESYAPENAQAEIKKSATAVIGHNHKDGIAHFLRERFSL